MTRIDFYFNVDNKFRQVAKFAEVALARQRRLFVFTSCDDAATQFETMLWAQTPTGFLPHCRSNHHLAAETPIMVDWQGTTLPHDDILINLTPTHPSFFSRFKRLIELVGVDENDRMEARSRYRFYRDRGYEIRSHNAAGVRE
jgi:DNA polymerase III subunit chi